ncbi:2-aminoethylphosphonate--pyruvate transaminase [Alphaproteobacteria bacterium HT1-32]|nr:2-aminoethylphosphonate--pyruvate transaminase [Alphaproteobacteria bacterium HT1-32]
MTTDNRDPWLLTPGPLTTSLTVKQAMLHDWGSRDTRFIEMTARIRSSVLALAGGEGTHVAVPLQGSGTFIVEATIATLLPRDGKLLVLVNGAYGHRMVKMCKYLDRACEFLEWAEDVPVNPAEVVARLEQDKSITHVAVVHCETTSGILNPLSKIAEVVAAQNRSLLIDTMSAFGALPVDAREIHFDALMASSNKCLEGAPGVGFAVIRQSVLEKTAGNSHSLSLDLYEQWKALEANGQWRFTPPTHVLAALDVAIAEHHAEGGVAGRGARYADNCRILIDGMREMGFETLLPDSLQAPIIITFHMPEDPAFDFGKFYDRLAAMGFVIYPGKLTVAPSFRVGCIGRLGADEMRGALAAVKTVITEMGVTRLGPPKAA